MTPNQLRKALRKLPNVSAFCRAHDIPRRTAQRMKEDEYWSPLPATLALFEKALKKEGIVSASSSKTGHRNVARRVRKTVGRRHPA